MNDRTSTERLALIRQTLADLEKNGHNCDWGREADLKWLLVLFDEHTTRVREFLQELGPYLGLEEGTVKPADFIEAAKRIRQWCADHQGPRVELPAPPPPPEPPPMREMRSGLLGTYETKESKQRTAEWRAKTP